MTKNGWAHFVRRWYVCVCACVRACVLACVYVCARACVSAMSTIMDLIRCASWWSTDWLVLMSQTDWLTDRSIILTVRNLPLLYGNISLFSCHGQILEPALVSAHRAFFLFSFFTLVMFTNHSLWIRPTERERGWGAGRQTDRQTEWQTGRQRDSPTGR